MKYSFTKVAKDFKNKYKSLKTSEILIVLLSKATSQESCSLNEKTKFQSNTGLLLITKFVYLLIVNLIFKISVNLEEVIFLQSCYSVAKSCLTLCHPMDCSMPDFTVLHYLPEFAQTHVHWVSDAIQPPHPLSPPSPLLSIFPSIRVFSKESVFVIRWPKYWSFSISPSNEYSGLAFF